MTAAGAVAATTNAIRSPGAWCKPLIGWDEILEGGLATGAGRDTHDGTTGESDRNNVYELTVAAE